MTIFEVFLSPRFELVQIIFENKLPSFISTIGSLFPGPSQNGPFSNVEIGEDRGPVGKREGNLYQKAGVRSGTHLLTLYKVHTQPILPSEFSASSLFPMSMLENRKREERRRNRGGTTDDFRERGKLMMLLLQLVFSTFTFEEGVFFAERINSFVDVNRSIEDEFTLDEEF